MCEDYWEWELARRRKLLELADPRRDEEEALEDAPEAVVLPPPPIEGKRRALPMLAR